MKCAYTRVNAVGSVSSYTKVNAIGSDPDETGLWSFQNAYLENSRPIKIQSKKTHGIFKRIPKYASQYT